MTKCDRGYEEPMGDNEGIDFDGPPNPARDRYGRLVPTRCTCNARSEEPCSYCSMPGDEP